MNVYLAMPIDGVTGSELGQSYKTMKRIIEKNHPKEHIYIRNAEIYESLEAVYGDEHVPGYLNADDVYSPFQVIGNCIKELNWIDVVYFHPTWDISRGCQLEHLACKLYNKPICEVSDKDYWTTFETVY